jgi:P27 family predicted phage terminase small subunit
MTIPGTKPKPTFLKLIEGNPGKRPLNENEPKFKKTKTKAPSHLGDVGKREWNRVSKILYKQGLLTEADLTALAAYCESYEQALMAYKYLEKGGVLPEKRVVGEKTYTILKPNPFFDIWTKCRAQMKMFMTEFGMTPSSRSRIGVKGSDEKDELEAMID